MTAVTIVPNASAAMPNIGSWPVDEGSGNHFWKVKKLTLLTRSAGTAFQTRNTAIPAMIASTRSPAERLSPRKIRSPGRTDVPRIGDRSSGSGAADAGGSSVGVVVIGSLLARHGGPVAP